MSADRDGHDLTARQHRTIVALLAHDTIAAAAKAAKVDEKTLRKWLKQPAFAAAYREASAEVLAQALIGLNRLAAKAIKTLGSNLGARGERGVQVRAAKVLLDKAIQVQAMADLQAEVAELKAQLERVNAEPRQPADGAPATPGGGGELGPAAGEPDAGAAAVGPDAAVPGDGPDAGPVAGGVPDEPEPPGIAPLFPAGG